LPLLLVYHFCAEAGERDVKRLVRDPTRNVTTAPIRKYHVNATLVN
jgi:hypothetical protein